MIYSEVEEEISRTGSGALELVVRGASLARILNTITTMAARLRPNIRCAILLFEDEGFRTAADHRLSPEERTLLRTVGRCSTAHSLAETGLKHGFLIQPLLTQTAELIGALVIFGAVSGGQRSLILQDMEEVCWLSTLAIEQKHLTEELTYQAHHDPLTHLWNRIWMEGEIDRVLTTSGRKGDHIGLLVVGIDRFRVLNDVLGCQVGNELLRQVARRLSAALETGSLLARNGGDEFLVLMPHVISSGNITDSTERILNCFSAAPFYIGDHKLMVTMSVGSATAEPFSCTAAELQTRAYTAFRYAKKRCPGRTAHFDPSMSVIPPERLVMEQHLRFALQKHELELYYQPQVELATGTLAGVEALLRWNHPALGFISPGTFIPIMEEIGIVEEVGEWVLDEALRQKAAWERAGVTGLRVAVNVSSIQFSRANFAALVAQKLRHFNLKPEELELEITESVVMTNFEHGRRQLNLLRSLGVLIAIDDFGTGHSSLAYLQQLPVHRLKIDRMFIQEIMDREERPALLASIIGMARALNLSVIAEGVETIEQLLALSGMRCEEIQGYYFGRAMPARDLPRWMEDHFLRENICQTKSLVCD